MNIWNTICSDLTNEKLRQATEKDYQSKVFTHFYYLLGWYSERVEQQYQQRVGSTVQYVTGCTLSGFKISGKDDYVGNNIFIPFTGARDPNLTYTYNNHRFASYWFSTCEDNTTYPQFFSFRRSSGGIPHIEIYWQHFEYATEALYGRAIRAVLK